MGGGMSVGAHTGEILTTPTASFSSSFNSFKILVLLSIFEQNLFSDKYLSLTKTMFDEADKQYKDSFTA